VSAGLELGPDGRARSTRFDDMYQPDTDGAQARAVFLAGNGLPERFVPHTGPFTVLELGFGTGLNFLETWRAWRAAGAPCELRYIGIDAHPLTRAEARAVALARAKAASTAPVESALLLESARSGDVPVLAEDVRALVESWPERAPEAGSMRHTLAFETPPQTLFHRVALLLMHEEFEHALGELAESAPATVDAVYLDGFAPAKNPSAWTPAIFSALGRVVRAGGTAATWSVAGVVRRGLANAGFTVERRTGHGAKRERLTAVRARSH
jgi:tRNA 5-methylaminomethyl-2-thiouridine biosynthesis bifunctional protein